MTATVQGITLPFYPMRPVTGRRVTRDNVKDLYSEAHGELWFGQKKLNGDRAIMAIQDGKVTIANRRGSLFKHPTSNSRDFLKLPSGTILDGEVWKKSFYPFEAIIVDNVLLLDKPPQYRAAEAERLVKLLGHQWLFNEITLEWLERLDTNLPDYEGLVLKRRTSSYMLGGSESAENHLWQRRKWC